MQELKTVRFTKSIPPYTVGEIAGFNPTKAQDFVKAGVAAFYVTEEVKAEEAVTRTAKDKPRKKKKRVRA